MLGKAVDTLGEKRIFVIEALLLILVCCGYGLARSIFSERLALVVAGACFIMDQLLMSVNMARATYLKKISVHPDHVTPALTMSVSLDHIFSICIALTGGIMWARWGYQTVFLFGGCIAVLNLISALFVKVPIREDQ